jgi:hypothetical protein
MERGGSMLYIFNYNIKEGRMEEFQKFIKENEKTIAKQAPKGWKYMGTYFYVLGFGPYCAADLWECSNYADFDTWRNYDNPTWVKLWKQAVEYCTSEPVVSWLLREAGDTKILEPKKKP